MYTITSTPHQYCQRTFWGPVIEFYHNLPASLRQRWLLAWALAHTVVPRPSSSGPLADNINCGLPSL
jgi:hypothetical protein